MTSVVAPIQPYPGLDYEEVLENMSGNKNLLTSLARLFLEQHAADLMLIEVALLEQNRDLALQLTHTLRGTAGNIGGMAVHDATLDLEYALRNQLDEPVVIPADLRTAMTELTSSLQRLVTEPLPA